MFRKKSLIVIVILLISIIFTIINCGRKGTLNPNSEPQIVISEYSGIARPDTVENDTAMYHDIGGLITDPNLYDSIFCQKIYWDAWDADGTVEGYAYRIGTWDSTANNWVYDKAYGIRIDTTIETTSENYGWVLHEQPNGEFGIWTPPDERFAQATIYFPSTDTSDFRKNFGKFDVKCKDNYNEESEIATRYFVTYSEIPETFISTSQGNIDSCRVGTAIKFKFYVNDNDPFGYGSEAAYYKYRIVNVERVGAREDTLGKGHPGYEFSIGNEILDSTDWFSSRDSTKTDEVFLHLDANDINELTQIQVKAVDKAGIEDPDYAKMTFFVRDYFTPMTAPFADNPLSKELDILPEIFVLGEYHYLTYLSVDKDIPKKIVGGKYHYSTQFYYNKDDTLTAVWSDDIEIHLKWEYLGEYIYDSETHSRGYKGFTYFYDASLTPSYIQYYCDVEYMEIQLDGGVTGIPPIGAKITDAATGEDWIRIPIYEDQVCKLYNAPSSINLSPGKHIFRVRAVDSQGAADPNPIELVFILFEMGDKNNILLIDETVDDTFSPEDSVDVFFNKLTDGVNSVIVFDLEDDNFTTISLKNQTGAGHRKAPSFALSDIINYKLIIWHYNKISASYYNNCKLRNHYNLLKIYMNTGGNLLFTGCNSLREDTNENVPFLYEYCGFTEDNDVMNKSMPEEPQTYFCAAKPIEEDYNELHIKQNLLKLYTTSSMLISKNRPFNDWVNGEPEYWTKSNTFFPIIDTLESQEKQLVIYDTLGQSYYYQNCSTLTHFHNREFKLGYKSKQEQGGNQYKLEVWNLSDSTLIEQFIENNTSGWVNRIHLIEIPVLADSVQIRLYTPEIAGYRTYWDNVYIWLYSFSYDYPEYFKKGSTVSYCGGIGYVSFFSLQNMATPIFSAVVVDSLYADNYNGVVASKYTKEEGETGTAYILGFPLYYIHLDNAKQFIHKVFDEVGISYQE